MYERQEVMLQEKEHCHPFLKIKHDWNRVILFDIALQKVIQSIKKVPSGVKIGK